MLKKTIGMIAAALLFGAPALALASTQITFLTLDGGSSVTVPAGDSADAKVTFNLTGTSENESLSWEIVDNSGNNVGIPPTCIDVNDHIVAGTYTVAFPMDTVGGTEGTFGVKVRMYGLTGNGADNNCGGVVNDTMNFPSVLTLTSDQATGDTANNTGHDSGGSSTGSVTKVGSIAWFQAQIASLSAAIAALAHPATPPAPTTSGVCTQYAQANSGTQPNVYNDANVRLQGFLLSQGASIPALKAGASFGFMGNQTTAAVGWFLSLNHC